MSQASIRHFNCATICPPCARLVTGQGGYFERGRMGCHVLVVETRRGLALIDTGIGRADLVRGGLSGWFDAIFAPAYQDSETAVAQIEAMGAKKSDVADIFVTHLDLDHAGGIPDFPHATVHVRAAEKIAAFERRGLQEKTRYLPHQYAAHAHWESYADGGDTWRGFAGVMPARGFDGEIAIVPLSGHSAGHSGIAVKSGEKWVLHAGDATYNRGEFDASEPRRGVIEFFASVMAWDGKLRAANVARLGQLVREYSDVDVITAHDPADFVRYGVRVGR